MIRFVFVSVLGLLLVPVTADAQDVIISEIMPDPDQVSDSDGEYIELYNNTASGITLDNWTLDVDNGETDDLSGVTIPSEDFVVLCVNGDATSNGSIENCAKDYVNGITLNNSGSTVVLKDNNSMQVDKVDYGSSWSFASGASMEFVGAPGDDNNTSSNWQEADTRRGDFAGESGDFGSPNANADGGKLPVELTTFDVAANADRVRLSWATASETNNAGFAIQHRAPGRDEWTKRGFVEGAGTTTQPQSYRFTTDALASGTHTFRLKQIDTDGTGHYSEPQTVTVRGETGLRILSVNPLRNGRSARIAVQVGTAQSVEVALYDVLGQRVRTVASERATPGQPVRATVSTGGLASGVYFLRARGTSFETTRRLTVLR